MSKKTSKKPNEKKTDKQTTSVAKADRTKAIKNVAKAKKGKATKPAEADAVESGATAASDSGEAVEGGAVAAPAPRAPNDRLPPVGTRIEKKDRLGNVRCACTVEADGIHYGGKVYSSISGAAMAAAIDIGLKNKTQNGYTFWGLEKTERIDPKEATERAWERYHNAIEAMVKGSTDGNKREVKALLDLHTHTLERLQDRMQEQRA